MDKAPKKPGSLKKNSALNAMRQVCAVLFPLVTFPYATRVLGAGNYGKVQFGFSIIGCIALVACLGVIEYAIREGAKVRDDKASFQKLASQVFSINIMSMAFSYLLLIMLLLFWKKTDGYSVLLLIQSLCILFTTLGTDWINTVYEDYAYITVRYIICHLISLALMFLLVHGPEDYILYALACVSTDVLAGIANVFYIRRRYGISPRFTLDIGGNKHLGPIMILFGSTVASFFYINSDVVMLGILKDEYAVGIYSAAARIYLSVKQVLNASLAVAIPRVSNNIAGNKDNTVLLNKIRTALLLILMPACCGLFAISDNIVLLFSGSGYLEAGPLLKILSIALFFATSGCYYVSVIMIPYKKEKLVLYGTIVSAVVNVGLNAVFIPIYGYYAAAVTTVISEVIMLATGVIFTRSEVRPNLVKPYIVSAVNICLILAIAFAADLIFSSNIAILAVTVALSVLSVALVIFLAYYKEASPHVRLFFKKLAKDRGTQN